MSLDLNNDYKRIKDELSSIKAYNDLKGSYDEITKDGQDFYNNLKSDVTQGVNKVKDNVKRHQREIKNQFQQLIDINSELGQSLGSLKRVLLKTLKLSKPLLNQILYEESIDAIGCDQQQSFTGQTIYIKVASIDLNNILKNDPDDVLGAFLYEPNQIQLNSVPFSMNRQLYQLTQSNLSFSGITGQAYKGISGQDLFDIKFVERKPLTGEYGPWYEVKILNRVGVNKVGPFLLDYFQTIDIADFNNIMGNIMEGLTGCFSIAAEVGTKQIENTSRFEIIIQRILGLCFDNDEEINTSGIAKIGEIDNIDPSFFEIDELDLRKIDRKIENIRNGVVEFLQCDNVKFPVNAQAIINSVINLRTFPENEQIEQAANLTNTLINNPNWKGLSLDINIDAKIDYNFLNVVAQGLLITTMSPKVLLPIFIITKAIGDETSDLINNFDTFVRRFKSFVIKIISKFGAVFIEKLFEVIKTEIKRLIRNVIQNIAKEQQNKIYAIILRLVSLLLVVAQLIADWRKCKTVVDEILLLLRLSTSGIGNAIPLPLLFASQLLDGYSETRAFIGSIKEMQKLGIPTGPLPDGSPNLEMQGIYGTIKAQASEEANSSLTVSASPPLPVTPAGFTVPGRIFGKKL